MQSFLCYFGSFTHITTECSRRSLLCWHHNQPASPQRHYRCGSSTRPPFPKACLCCCAGIIPECSILCYFGSLSEDISSVIDGRGGAHGPIKYVLMGVTCFFMITAVVWSTFVVRCSCRMHGGLVSSEYLHLCNMCTKCCQAPPQT